MATEENHRVAERTEDERTETTIFSEANMLFLFSISSDVTEETQRATELTEDSQRILRSITHSTNRGTNRISELSCGTPRFVLPAGAQYIHWGNLRQLRSLLRRSSPVRSGKTGLRIHGKIHGRIHEMVHENNSLEETLFHSYPSHQSYPPYASREPSSPIPGPGRTTLLPHLHHRDQERVDQ